MDIFGCGGSLAFSKIEIMRWLEVDNGTPVGGGANLACERSKFCRRIDAEEVAMKMTMWVNVAESALRLRNDGEAVGNTEQLRLCGAM